MKPLAALQELQRECDELSFHIHDKEMAELTLVELLNHKCFHLANLVAKVSRVCEQADHGVPPATEQIAREVIPDLIVYSLQLANRLGVEVSEALLERYRFIMYKHDDAQRDQKDDVERRIAEVLG